MTEQEFLQLMSLHVETWCRCDICDCIKDRTVPEQMCGDYHLRQGKNLSKIKMTDCILVSWVAGGWTGGSCWNTKHYPIRSEPEPIFTVLDEILEIVCPTLLYVDYIRLIVPSINRGIHEQHEYYDNVTLIGYRYISLSDLFIALRNIEQR